MADLHLLRNVALGMAHSAIHNYAIPGLTSSLVGSHPSGEKGQVRLFTADLSHEQPIVPHSHRFYFACLVLEGRVRNRVWVETPNGEPYRITEMDYRGEPGHLARCGHRDARFSVIERVYREGEVYAMEADEIHSIFFDRGTTVLFFEGPPTSETSVILEPIVDGEVIPTFKVEPWMFKRSA